MYYNVSMFFSLTIFLPSSHPHPQLILLILFLRSHQALVQSIDTHTHTFLWETAHILLYKIVHTAKQATLHWNWDSLVINNRWQVHTIHKLISGISRQLEMFVNARTNKRVKDCPSEASVEQALTMLRSLAITNMHSSSVQNGTGPVISDVAGKRSSGGQAEQARQTGKRQKLENQLGSSTSSSECSQHMHSTNSLSVVPHDAKRGKIQLVDEKINASSGTNTTTSVTRAAVLQFYF